MHGLANRIRAMVSALVIAKFSGRKLTLIWEIDPHCRANYLDLFELTPEIEFGTRADIESSKCKHYDYMDPDVKYTKIDTDESTDICVSSAYVILSTNVDAFGRHGNPYRQQLRIMPLSSKVKEIMKTIVIPDNSIGVHVRQRLLTQGDVPGIENITDHRTDYNAMSPAESDKFRASCSWQSFLPAILPRWKSRL